MMQNIPPYWFIHTCTVQNLTSGLTDGAVTQTYANAGGLVGTECRVVAKGGGERIGDRTSGYNIASVYFPGAPLIVNTSRIVFNSRVFDVDNVQNFDEASVYTRCDCHEVFPSAVGA